MSLKLRSISINGYPEFKPKVPWLGADLQTLKAFLTPRPIISHFKSSSQLDFLMDDGSDDKLSGIINICDKENTQLPLIVLIHGLTGCDDSSYMCRTANYFLQSGYSVLRLNLRGAKPGQDLCREHYHAGRGVDLNVVLNLLVERGMASNGFIIMGFSLGGNMLLKFLDEYGAGYAIHAGVSISAPIDLASTSERLMQPRNKVYHKWLLHNMKSGALALRDLSEKQKNSIRNAKTVFEFDDRFIAPQNGFLGAIDYYKRCSGKESINNIKTPTLVISALNDPWVPSVMYVSRDWGKAPYVRAILPKHGGHVGFHEHAGCWYNRVSKLFFSELGV